MTRRLIATAAGAAVIALSLSACVGGSNGSGDSATANADAFKGDVKGTITVLTNRTDLVDTTLKDYSAAFAKKYPGTTVKWEAITNYEDDVTIRLNSKDYGDVLLIPNKVAKDQLGQFFEPLGTVDDLGKTYRFVNEQAYGGNVYGLATFGTAQGYVVNKKVWAKAGITTPPKTTEEFLQDLQAIKDQEPGVTPYYTNYADGWPLTQWQSNQGEIAGPDTVQQRDADDAPWAAGKEQSTMDGLLFDVVHQKLSEADPTTTNWEESKNLLGTGKVATMVLGSWAVPQMQDAAVKAGGSKDDITFWPMPWQKDGAFQSTVGGDYKIGISKTSKNLPTAKAFLDWFEDESGFSAAQGGLSPRIDGATPDVLADFTKYGVKTLELQPAPAGKESLDSDIYNAAEIDLTGPNYKKKLVDIARGAAKGDKDSYFADLNKKWAEARTQVAK
ncbi:ABC transporter substrate-binding protein [Luteimicrobium subarcticum]|uniref:Carbohydrate ABC transporter substrate-binding protein (CUT1 family) n=1 Tax=Luteimicrobium subarcticum TaxID=620910 RepID=A0A2M8WRL4_9MICO|nr:extracellular solute-binding protein [Luteimicrobium subarcticum]PJI93583.1 carbohydrate ABC transporter substrate-binding protein (CUT1 family) [Luteimicrobium subarcticum]